MKRVHTLLSAAVVSCAGTNIAHAQHSVSLSTGIERVENPLLSSTSPGGVTVLRIAPNYVYEAQGDQTRSRFSAGAVLERSSNTALVAHRDYPNLGYTWAYSWPTASVELRASLAESATRNSEFRDLGRVTIDSRERSVVTGAVWDQEITARTRWALSVDNTRVSYNSALLEDYRELGVSSRFSWDATERDSYFFEPSYARLTPSSASAVASQTRWLVGTRKGLTPDWSLTAHAGQARTGGIQKSKGTLGRLQLTFSGSRLSSEVEWSQDVTASGFAAAYVQTKALGLRLSYRIAEGVAVLASVSRSESGGVSGGRGSSFALSLENELSPHWSSTLGFEDRQSRDASGTSGKGWAIRAGVVYAFPGR